MRTAAPSRSASPPRTTRSSDAARPLCTSTRPSGVRIPSTTLRSRARSLSITNATKPRSVARIAPWGATMAALAVPTGTFTSQNVPGFGGSFEAKYKADRDQILTEIFDYIRCANMRDSTHDKEFNTFAEPKRTREKERYKFAPRGIVVPIHFSREGRENIGFGRFPTISEAALVLYHAGYVGNDDSVYLDRREKAKRGVKKNLVRAFMVFETFNPMQGYAPTQTPNGNSLEQRPIAFELEGLDAFQLGGKALGFPQKARNSFIHASGSLWGGRNSGGSEGFRCFGVGGWHVVDGVFGK